jgi:hypothetical protein
MPHVLQPAAAPCLPTINDRRSVRPRAVIGHQDLEVGVALMGERAQHRVERVRTVVGGNDD